MADPALGRARHVAQGLFRRLFDSPRDAAGAFGAHQGQDLPGVVASLALRSGGDLHAVVAAWITQLCVGPGLRQSVRLLEKRGLGERHRARSEEIAREKLAAGPRPRAELGQRWAEAGRAVSRPLLLPGFDEFILGYRDRLFAMTQDVHERLVPGNNGMFRRPAISGGRVVGTWKRGGPPSRRCFELEEFAAIPDRTRAGLAACYDAFPFLGG